MRKSALSPDYRTREVISNRLRGLRRALEVEGVRHAALFGSVARGEDVAESDVDTFSTSIQQNALGCSNSRAFNNFSRRIWVGMSILRRAQAFDPVDMMRSSPICLRYFEPFRMKLRQFGRPSVAIRSYADVLMISFLTDVRS